MRNVGPELTLGESQCTDSLTSISMAVIPRRQLQNRIHDSDCWKNVLFHRRTECKPRNIRADEDYTLLDYSPLMPISLSTLLATLSSIFCSRASLLLENLALRHQIGVLKRSAKKCPKLTSGDRLLWICLSRLWGGWHSGVAGTLRLPSSSQKRS